jgi:hypothetical protein
MKTGSIRRNYLFGAVGGLSNDHASACEPRRGVRNWWRYYALFGLAAISTFTLALPGTAFACVNSCSGGSIAVNSSGFPFCSGGSDNGQLVCTSGDSGGGGGGSGMPTKMSFRRGFDPWTGSPDTTKIPIPVPGLYDPWTGSPDTTKVPVPVPGLYDPPSSLGGPTPSIFHLGMYVTPDSAFGNSVAFGAGGFSARSSGVGVTDKAGLLAPGSLSTSSQTNAGSGGIAGSYDASYLVGSNQKLVLNGAFNYTASNTGFSAGSGSINGNTYGFNGSALYSNYATYLVLSGSYEFGNNSEFFAADASSGRYRSDGYDVDARVGHVFMLYNSIAAPVAPSRMPLKAPPRAADGGYAIGLDLSGHLGYANEVARGFTDTSGFVFGDERVQGGETGLRAKLFAAVPRNGVVWQPYISGSVDWRFDYSHVAYFPTQVALAGGDAVTFADATTFVGAQIGLDVKATNGWIVGVNGFYSHSSDTEIAGGRAFVRIPFGPSTVAARY